MSLMVILNQVQSAIEDQNSHNTVSSAGSLSFALLRSLTLVSLVDYRITLTKWALEE